MLRRSIHQRQNTDTRFIETFFYLDWCRARQAEPPAAVSQLVEAGA